MHAVREARQAEGKVRDREADLACLHRLSTIGPMSSELAHELTQPLYAIANFADAALNLLHQSERFDRDQLQRWLEQIAIQARRGGHVLKRFTQFVHKGELHLQPLDLNVCVHTVVAMLEHELRRRTVDVRLELLPQLPQVSADALLIEQVLANLIRNAAEAMDVRSADQRRLRIRTFMNETALIGCAVSDSGPGLEGDPNRIFESYFTTKTQGTGLGLAICRSAIEAHEGRIWATSNSTAGATFEFVLPVASEAATPVSPE